MQTDTQSTQQPSQAPWPPFGWLTKQQAADRLNLSPSRVFALGEAGTIKTQRLKSPTSGQFVTIFHAGDIERVIYERENPDKVSKLPAKVSKLPAKLAMPTHSEMVAAAERAALNGFSLRFPEPLKAASPDAPKPWITVSEAAEYTGLPASILTKLVKSGSLPAIDCGPRPGGKWRVKRSDLDALEGQR